MINLLKTLLADKKVLNEKHINIIMVLVAITLGAYLNWGLKEILAFSLIVWVFLSPMKPELFAKASLISLVLALSTMLINRVASAEVFAMLSFGFLLLTVGSKFLEDKSHNENK